MRYDFVDFGYLRKMDFDQDRRKVLTAQRLKANELQYHEPASDIFHEHTNDSWFMKHATSRRPTE